MRIKPGQHAVDRVFDQILVIHRINVLRAHALNDVTEDLEHLIHISVAAVLGKGATQVSKARAHRDTADEGRSDQQAIAPLPNAKIHAFFPFDAVEPLLGA